MENTGDKRHCDGFVDSRIVSLCLYKFRRLTSTQSLVGVHPAGWHPLTTYTYGSVKLSYAVTKTIQNFTKKHLCQDFKATQTLLLK
jgi:hypothetical protein